MTAVDSILARLLALHPKRIDLSLDRMWRVLERLGHPERRVPPVIHVAGTNGKGSTIAFLRAMLEAAGQERARLHLAQSGARQRALPARLAGRRPAGVGRRACRRARRMRARERRCADHAVRDRDRGGLRAVRAPSRRHAAARSRPRRAARRHQCDRASARERGHAGLDGSHRVSRRHAGEDRRREGRHLPRRRAGRDRAADRSRLGGAGAPGREGARAAACRGPALARACGARAAGLSGRAGPARPAAAEAVRPPSVRQCRHRDRGVARGAASGCRPRRSSRD